MKAVEYIPIPWGPIIRVSGMRYAAESSFTATPDMVRMAVLFRKTLFCVYSVIYLPAFCFVNIYLKTGLNIL